MYFNIFMSNISINDKKIFKFIIKNLNKKFIFQVTIIFIILNSFNYFLISKNEFKYFTHVSITNISDEKTMERINKFIYEKLQSFDDIHYFSSSYSKKNILLGIIRHSKDNISLKKKSIQNIFKKAIFNELSFNNSIINQIEVVEKKINISNHNSLKNSYDIFSTLSKLIRIQKELERSELIFSETKKEKLNQRVYFFIFYSFLFSVALVLFYIFFKKRYFLQK